jgi:hypothetical protein
MIKITLKIDDRGSLLTNVSEETTEQDDSCHLMQHMGTVGFLDGVNDLLVVLVRVQEQVITDTNNRRGEGDHASSLTGGLAVADLTFRLIQIDHIKSQEARGAGEREASACGLVTKDGDSNVAWAVRGQQTAAVLLLPMESLEQQSGKDQHTELMIVQTPGENEILLLPRGESVLLGGQ